MIHNRNKAFLMLHSNHFMYYWKAKFKRLFLPGHSVKIDPNFSFLSAFKFETIVTQWHGKKDYFSTWFLFTGKSFSEALIFASTNTQYDDRLFIELQVQCMKISSSNLGRSCCVQKLFLTFRTISVHNMFSPWPAKRRASDKDLPVP